MNDNSNYPTQMGEMIAEALAATDLDLDGKREALAVAARLICDQFSRVPACDFSGRLLTGITVFAKPNYHGMAVLK